MSAPICPYCGDGMESIGTLNHIECATELLAKVERLNKVVVSQSQQLGNTRSQREHELIEELADAEAEVERLKATEQSGVIPTARYVNPETGHGSATGANQPSYEMTAYVVDWKQRAEAAEKLVYDLSVERDDLLLRAQNAEADLAAAREEATR